MQTDEEMLERVLQNSGYPGNGLRHDHQQLACSSLVFMIGLPELSLMTLVSEESPSPKKAYKISIDGFILFLPLTFCLLNKSINYSFVLFFETLFLSCL